MTGYWNRSSVVVVIPYNPSGLEFGVPSAVLPVTTLIGVLDYNNDVATPPTTYNGLTVTAIESVKYFRMTANYTYSHTIDNGNFTTFYQPAAEPIRLRFGTRNSNQDLRHNLVTNFTATAPEHTFLRNFELSSIMSLQSGKSFTLFAGQNTFGDVAGVSTDRVGGAPVTGECTSVSNCSTTVGRNTYTGAPCISWDLRLSRNFTISEGKILDLSVDSFNLLLPSAELLPKHYNDATTLAIQQSASSVSCAPQQAIGNPGAWVADGLVPVTIPNFPNARFRQTKNGVQPAAIAILAQVFVLRSRSPCRPLVLEESMNKIAPCLACVRSMGRRVGRYHPRRVDESSAEMTKEEGRGDARNVSCSAVTAVSGRDGWRSSECATVCLLEASICIAFGHEHMKRGRENQSESA